MKKIFISLLVGAMAATLTGCVNNGVEHDSPGTSTSNNSTSNTSADGSSSATESDSTNESDTGSDSDPFSDESEPAAEGGLSSVTASSTTSDS